MTIAEEITILDARLNAIATHDPEYAAALLKILQKFEILNQRGNGKYAALLHQVAGQTGDIEYTAWAHYYNCTERRITGDYNDALSEGKQALELFTGAKHEAGMAASHNSLGNVYNLLGDYTMALSHHQIALDVRSTIHMQDGSVGDIWGVASSHNNLGMVYSNQTNYQLALSNYHASIQIKETLPDSHRTTLGAEYKASLSGSYNNIATVYLFQGNYPESISYNLKALRLREELGDKWGESTSYHNLATVYMEQGDYLQTLAMFEASLRIKKEISDERGVAYAQINIGSTYYLMDNYAEALVHLNLARDYCIRAGDDRAEAIVCNDIGLVYFKLGQYADALDYYQSSLKTRETKGYNASLSNLYISLGQCYTAMRDYGAAAVSLTKAMECIETYGPKKEKKNALKACYELEKAKGDGLAALDYHERYVAEEKEILNEETHKKIAGLQFGYQIEKKEQEVAFEREKKEALQTAYDLLGKEKERSESLLLNILPAEVAEELKEKGTAQAKLFDEVTVLFTDFKDFTLVSERLSPQALVDELHFCFSAFDGIMSRHNIEKIKTVGDAYLAVAGLPLANANHAEDMIKAAIEVRDFMAVRQKALAPAGREAFHVRIGIHSGPVVAGIVGMKKFAYDIWGDTVNIAARMEQQCEEGKINISKATYDLVKDKFTCTHRGKVAAKNKGGMDMYFVN